MRRMSMLAAVVFCTALAGWLVAVQPAQAGGGGTCEGDIDGDGQVSVTDLLIVLANFGPCDGGTTCKDHADCDDGDPCTFDFCFFGTCQHVPDPGCEGGGGTCEGDLDGDGVVGILDLLTVLANFGPCEGEGCQSADECDDGDECTIDFCLAGTCVNLEDPDCP